MKIKNIIIMLLVFVFGLAACQETTSESSKMSSNIESSSIVSKTPVASSTKQESSSSTISEAPSSSVFSESVEIERTTPTTPEPVAGYNFIYTQTSYERANLSASGFVAKKMGNFHEYENTDAYRKVSTASELLKAIKDAKSTYSSKWIFDPRTDAEKAIIDELNELEAKRSAGTITKDENTRRVALENEAIALNMPGHVEQQLQADGKVKVIEIMNDLDMGYITLKKQNCDLSIVEDAATKAINQYNKNTETLPMSDMYLEHGISTIKIENTSNLMIFSRNKAKLTHCGIKLTSDTNIVIRNLEFDELWQWEDTLVTNPNYKVGDYDVFGWAYFKISHCETVWIDHCTFGKSYDGQIDVANPYYTDKGTAFRAPYGAKGGCYIHISYCNFKAGNVSKGTYIYDMMKKIEDAYTAGTSKYLYYNTLRDMGCTFEEILNGIVAPQKKGFLLGDSGNGTTEYDYNKNLNISFANNVIMNFTTRIPKLRGGTCYFYNNYVDCREYQEARAVLKGKNAHNISSKNSKFKCALTNEGILCGNGGNIQVQNCVLYGIETLLKNNDSGGGNGRTVNAGYNIINCKYKKTYSSIVVTGDNEICTSTTPTTLSNSNFKWNTEDGKAPFKPATLPLSKLVTYLVISDCKAGVTTNLQDMVLYTDYDQFYIIYTE